jgi:hypothetical protein
MTAKTWAELAVTTVLMGACASSSEDESILSKNDAIDDYIEVGQLKEIDQVRAKRQLRHAVITEHYVMLYDGKTPYLLAFQRRCRELNELPVKADLRHDLRILRARFDTYRGCRIRSLYELTKGQAQEIVELGNKETI